MPRVRKLALALAGAALLASGTTHALTLGDIALKSTLEQPLDAEIELLDARGLPITDVRPDLATALEFNKIGIPRPAHLEGLHFKAVQRPNGRTVINVTSDKPINEPYLNFLVEVRWPSGRLLREYTLLLDAPIYAQGSTPPKMARLPVIENGAAPDGAGRMPAPVELEGFPAMPDVPSERPPRVPAKTTPASTLASTPLPTVPAPKMTPKMDELAEKPAMAEAVSGRTQADEYRTQRNDTLWEIARQMRNDRALTVQQTMLAIQQINPEAFNNGNINRLKVGQVLRLPDEQQIRSMSAAQAVAEVERQNRDWRTSARSLAETNTPRTLNATPEQPIPELPVVPSPKTDSLRLLAVEGGQSTRGSEKAPEGAGQGLRDQLALLEEQLSTGQREKQELSGRLTDLQGQLDTLQRLIELKDSQLARMQAELSNTPLTAANGTPSEHTKADAVGAAATAGHSNAPVTPKAADKPDATHPDSSPPTPDTVVVNREPLLWGAAGIGGLLLGLLFIRKRRKAGTSVADARQEEVPLGSLGNESIILPGVKKDKALVDAPVVPGATAAVAASGAVADFPDDDELSARLATETLLEPPVLNDRALDTDPPSKVDDGDAAFEAFMANTVRQVIRPLQEAGNTVSPEAFSFEGRSLAVALEAAQKLEQARDGLARGDTTNVRTLLEAVLREGDSQQQQEARALLGRLG